MWILEFVFFTITLLLAWTLFGYFLFLWFTSLFRRRETPPFPASWSMISLIVPCYNEESQIGAKIENIKFLDYPADRLEIVFADGGSTDRTLDLLEASTAGNAAIRVIRCPAKGKIAQLNHVIPLLHGEIIVNSDTDARMSPSALRWIAAEFAAAPDACVVGAYCCPDDSLGVETYYWDSQNRGRLLENDAGTSSIVIAQCYAFRQGLLQRFPDDVVADDIYVAFLANTLGFRTIYSRQAIALETRNPRDYSQFVPHKFRKSNAFLRESLRFLYRLPEMKGLFKVIFVTRIAQQLLLPWAILWWILIAGALITVFRYDVVFFGATFLFILFFLTSRCFAGVKLNGRSTHFSFATMVRGYVLTLAILLTTGLTYPFFRQGSSYRRIQDKEPGEERRATFPEKG